MKNQFLIANFLLLILVGCQTQKPEEIREISDFTGTLTQQEKDGGVLTPEMLWKFGRLGIAVLSPDAKLIAYTVKRYDAKTLGITSNIFVIPSGGGEPKCLTENQFMDVSPAWTADGRIAFLSNRYGNYQVWIMNADGSARMPFSDIEGGINAFQISPNGKYLLYTKDVKLETTVLEKHSDLPKANAKVMNDLMYRHWNDWTDYKFSHIFISEVVNSKAKDGLDIMPGELWDAPLSPYFDEAEFVWSPDSKSIAYTCKKLYGSAYAVSTNSDIYLYTLNSKTTKNLTEENKGYDKFPVFSPDATKLAYMSMETPGYEADKERLMVLSIETGQKDYVSENWDQNTHTFAWNTEGTALYLLSGYKATQQIYKVNLDEKKFRQITKGQHDYTHFSWVNNRLIGSKSTHQMADEVFVIDEETGKQEQITFINKNIYDKIKLGHTEERWVKTTDGKEMLVWVVYPPNFDSSKKYPAILYCQGGPQSTVSQFFSYRWNFAIMAANNYIIVAPNRRGLPSFGQEWNAQISGDYSGQNIQDYLSAIDGLKSEPFVDETKLACVGASYGGYSAFYLAGHHQKRFKAFIAHCGIYNWESMYASTEETFFPNHDLGGSYWDKNNKVAQRSYANSPHKFVQNWDTPIMIIHGEYDFRVPYTQSLEAFNAAQLRGVPSRLLYFPKESHFVSQAQNSILWQREFFNWLDTYLK